MTKTAMAIAALTLMTTASASEGILFCGTHFVKERDYTYQVLLKCGPPTWRSFDRWIYDRGPTQAMLKVLHIVEDQVSLIADRPRY